jgi:MFS superfamily sulfate permease-like transporter
MLVSGLEVTLPSSHPPLSIMSARSSLFASSHLPLLASSLFPAGFLCISVRSRCLSK